MNMLCHTQMELLCEVQQLSDQLAQVQKRGGNLSDVRLKSFLRRKLRQLDADLNLAPVSVTAFALSRKPR